MPLRTQPALLTAGLEAATCLTAAGPALDSEGLVVDGDGTYLVASETEPSVRRYSRTGRILDRLPVPDDLRVRV